MNTVTRISRYIRITRKSYIGSSYPPFLTFFINSICNMKCAHCFYWRSLNSKDDLTFDEIVKLSCSMGKIENLNLSGGEPFLRNEFADICQQFIQHNQVEQIYVPTNGYFTQRMVNAIERTLKSPSLKLFVVELSLDGMPEFHDSFRATKNAFRKAMESYEALADLQSHDTRLRIHAVSTATDRNMDEIQRLTTYLYNRCPKMDHHNLAIIRGDPKDPTLTGPQLKQYEQLYQYMRKLWAPREEGRYGAIVEPMLQWTKIKTIEKESQVVPCLAGVLAAVVYANGDVSLCETHQPLGNLRERSFWEIWSSAEANELRRLIARRGCWCTTETFMWPSIVHQPFQLVRILINSRAWQRPIPLPLPDEIMIDQTGS